MERACHFVLTPKAVMKSLAALWLLLSALAATGFGAVTTQLINVDFNQNNGVVWGGGGPNPGPTMSGAAVLGSPGDQWNGIAVNSGTNLALACADGSLSQVRMTFTSGGGYDANSFGGYTPFAGTQYNALMQDYLYAQGQPQTITLSGLKPNSPFKLVLYSAANGGTGLRSTYFTVNGVSQRSIWDGVTGSSLVTGVNYVSFSQALSDSSGNLSITYSGDGAVEGDINGFQIQTAQFKIDVSFTGTNLLMSFPTQLGLTYQFQWKNNLTDPKWTRFGDVVSGNGSVQIVTNPITAIRRVYRLQISTSPTATISFGINPSVGP